ncbi:other/FunK1 protein kinase [Coprinopsis cinerea okayama7|uniref:Other/FunK1 protein kinase n=1 Tax=Coprinopsis cinerea (strain Okayama-7 / 130 / ATCC MYA-4618 / FGSC 9003) TaxID=240176 RepID=A8PDS0_COPC7|nr:other/FunK1 protein kinase [Coprinopsis cinerea okayama7\|eukprot:XP_001840653.1 other/FunK1 protein kinase [Coprinopsis cinerea okayama7\
MYKMQLLEISFKPRDIRGRGTACWDVEGMAEEELLIKDSWISQGRTPEYSYFEGAASMPGLADPMDRDGEVTSTAAFHHDGQQKPKGFRRTKHRLVFTRHGLLICKFNTCLEFLWALIDAIDTHEKLVEQGVLHRDVSIANILIIKIPTIPWHSILIDLDLMKPSRVDEVDSAFGAGTRESQSLNVLVRCTDPRMSLPYSYLDDLESFFWVFCIVSIGYKSNGKAEPRPPWIKRWRHADMHRASVAKSVFFRFQPEIRDIEFPVSHSWGKHIQQLFWDLYDFFGDMCRHPARIAVGVSKITAEELFNKRVEHYATVRGYIKKAIDAIEAETSPEKRESEHLPPEESAPAGRREASPPSTSTTVTNQDSPSG